MAHRPLLIDQPGANLLEGLQREAALADRVGHLLARAAGRLGQLRDGGDALAHDLVEGGESSRAKRTSLSEDFLALAVLSKIVHQHV